MNQLGLSFLRVYRTAFEGSGKQPGVKVNLLLIGLVRNRPLAVARCNVPAIINGSQLDRFEMVRDAKRGLGSAVSFIAPIGLDSDVLARESPRLLPEPGPFAT